MKKIITSLLLIGVCLFPSNILFASENKVSFLQGLANVSTLKDYKMIQSMQGTIEIEEAEDHLTGEYRLNVNSVVGDKGMKSSNRLSMNARLINKQSANDDFPFSEMALQMNAEMNTENETDLYFKLNNFNITLEDALPFAVSDIENLKNMGDLYRGQWFHVNLDDLMSNTDSEEKPDATQLKNINDLFKKDPVNGLKQISNLMISSDPDISDDEKKVITKGIDLILNTKLFSQRTIVRGKNEGANAFSLDKNSIVKLMSELMELSYKNQSNPGTTFIRSMLSKISLGGLYTIEDDYNSVNNFLLKLKLKDLGVIKNSEFSLRYKLFDLNKVNTVRMPTDYEEWNAGSFAM